MDQTRWQQLCVTGPVSYSLSLHQCLSCYILFTNVLGSRKSNITVDGLPFHFSSSFPHCYTLARQLGGWPTELLPLLRRTSTGSCSVHLLHFRKKSGGDQWCPAMGKVFSQHAVGFVDVLHLIFMQYFFLVRNSCGPILFEDSWYAGNWQQWVNKHVKSFCFFCDASYIFQKDHFYVIMVAMDIMLVMVVMVIMVNLVTRTDRTTRTHGTNKSERTDRSDI